MTVTIHARGVQRSEVAHALLALAGGNRDAVKNSTNGLTVSDDLARAYLTSPSVPTGKPAMAVPPGLAVTVRDAEIRSGVGDPDQAPKPAKKTTRKSATSEATS